MMKQLLARDNLISALKRVEKNKGKHGVDEMPVKSLRAHLLLNWDDIRIQLKMVPTRLCQLYESKSRKRMVA
jgi:retron-type reverse transcriptase